MSVRSQRMQAEDLRSAAVQRRPRRRALIEPLEGRRLLSGAVTAPVPAVPPQIARHVIIATSLPNTPSIADTPVQLQPSTMIVSGAADIDLAAGMGQIPISAASPATNAPVVISKGANGSVSVTTTDFYGDGNTEFPLQGPPPTIVNVGVGGKLPKTFHTSDEHGGAPALTGAPPVLTPLAQTPSHREAANAAHGSAIPLPVTSVVAPPIAPTTVISANSPSHQPFLTTVISLPIEAFVAISPQTAVETGGAIAAASNKAVDVLAMVANPQTLGGEVAYNFVHFNPANLLNDAIASFTADSASISPASAPASSARAWTVTAAVIGMDVLFMGYWYQKSRREENSRRRTHAWALTIDPCQRRLL